MDLGTTNSAVAAMEAMPECVNQVLGGEALRRSAIDLEPGL